MIDFKRLEIALLKSYFGVLLMVAFDRKERLMITEMNFDKQVGEYFVAIKQHKLQIHDCIIVGYNSRS